PVRFSRPSHRRHVVGVSIGEPLMRHEQRRRAGTTCTGKIGGTVGGDTSGDLGSEAPLGLHIDDTRDRPIPFSGALGTRNQRHALYSSGGNPAQVGATGERIIHRESIEQYQYFVGCSPAHLRPGGAARAAGECNALPSVERLAQVAPPAAQEFTTGGEAWTVRGHDRDRVQLDRLRGQTNLDLLRTPGQHIDATHAWAVPDSPYPQFIAPRVNRAEQEG